MKKTNVLVLAGLALAVLLAAAGMLHSEHREPQAFFSRLDAFETDVYCIAHFLLAKIELD